MNKKSALIAAAIVVSAAGAQARDVTWSIGINAPLHSGVSIGTVISNAPVYRPAPVIYAEPVYLPAPVIVRHAPVVYMPQPVYAPQRVVYVPQRVVYVPARVAKGQGHGHWRHKHRHRGEPVMVRYDR